jgi:hypothetical protein
VVVGIINYNQTRSFALYSFFIDVDWHFVIPIFDDRVKVIVKLVYFDYD